MHIAFIYEIYKDAEEGDECHYADEDGENRVIAYRYLSHYKYVRYDKGQRGLVYVQ